MPTTAALELDDFERGEWGRRFPTVVAAWRRAWPRIIPFFAFPPEIRRVIYTTNALESVNAQLRKIIKPLAALIRWFFVSNSEAIAIRRNCPNSVDPNRPKPSAILLGAEADESLICSTSLASVHTVRSRSRVTKDSS